MGWANNRPCHYRRELIIRRHILSSLPKLRIADLQMLQGLHTDYQIVAKGFISVR